MASCKEYCKECIHNDICDLQKIIIENRDSCKHFKDHNRFVELPCKFLNNCFVLPTINNNFSDITEMKCIGFSLSHDSYNANLITDKNKLYQPRFEAFGKTVFLTREEAEQALKESEQK